MVPALKLHVGGAWRCTKTRFCQTIGIPIPEQDRNLLKRKAGTSIAQSKEAAKTVVVRTGMVVVNVVLADRVGNTRILGRGPPGVLSSSIWSSCWQSNLRSRP